MNRWRSRRVIYPARVEIETEMGRNSNYLEGIETLLRKYNLKDWEEPYGKLKAATHRV